MGTINTLPDPPWAGKTEDSIRTEMLGAVDPVFNTDEGDIVYDMLTPAAMECAQLYDQLTISLGLAFVETSTGAFLDALAAQLGAGMARMTGETDDAFRNRLLIRLQTPQGAGNLTDYQSWALAVSGVGYAVAKSTGPGLITVAIANPDRTVPSGTLITAVANALALVTPLGATVTVSAVSLTPVAITTEVHLAAGVALDAGMEAALTTALTNYVATLNPGDPVRFFEVSGVLTNVGGVTDLLALTLNGTGATVAMADSTHLATLGAVTLTAG